MDSKNVQVIVLAAGPGKRMGNQELPKVLSRLNGKPLVRYVIDAVKKSGISWKPVVVVGYKAEKVVAELGSGVNYAHQAEQLGTGHAVKCAKRLLADKSVSVLVLYGDMPFVMPETIAKLANMHIKSDSVLTMATVTVSDFDDWKKGFASFGRIVRNSKNQIESIVEAKDATPRELQIKECNPAVYCFDAKWLWESLELLENNNAQGEYYLTDLAAAAKREGHNIATIDINPHEAVGINTADELELALRLMDERIAV